jgi:hypothetical protein
MNTVAKFALLNGCLMLAGATHAIAEGYSQGYSPQGNSPRSAQIVALDECDPATFNAALGPDFCKNVTIGASTSSAKKYSMPLSPSL